MKKFAISQNSQVNQRLVFKTYDDAIEYLATIKDSNGMCVVKVWEFHLWFRQYDDKDFVVFYSAKSNVESAIEEAMKRLSPTFAIVMTEFGQVANSQGRIENEMLNNYKNSQC